MCAADDASDQRDDVGFSRLDSRGRYCAMRPREAGPAKGVIRLPRRILARNPTAFYPRGALPWFFFSLTDRP